MNMYIVLDNLGVEVRRFNSYKSAFTFLTIMQRYDWQIVKL